MFNPKLTEKELFLIYSLRKGYARSPDVIYGLAGFPWTEEEIDMYITHAGSNEEEHKKMDLQRYYARCKLEKRPPNIKEINRIVQYWDDEIEDKRQQSRERNDLQNARYEEFLKN